MCVATSVAVTAIPSLQPISTVTISSITPSAGSKPFKHTWPAGRSSGVGAAAGCGAAAAAAVRYGF